MRETFYSRGGSRVLSPLSSSEGIPRGVCDIREFLVAPWIASGIVKTRKERGEGGGDRSVFARSETSF